MLNKVHDAKQTLVSIIKYAPWYEIEHIEATRNQQHFNQRDQYRSFFSCLSIQLLEEPDNHHFLLFLFPASPHVGDCHSINPLAAPILQATACICNGLGRE